MLGTIHSNLPETLSSTSTPTPAHIVAQFKSKDGETVGSSFSLPVTMTPKELEVVLNHLLKNDTPLPYSFFINHQELRHSIDIDVIQPHQVSTESLITIVYQPQAMFRVRPVTRCGATLPGHTEAVLSVQFSPDGTQLASGSGDTTVRLWDLTTMTPKTTLPCHDHWVLALAWSPDGTRLASGSKDGKLCIYHQGPSVFQLQFQLHHHKGAITSLCWEPYHLNPTTSRVCSGGHDGTLRIWNSSGHCDWVLSQHTKPITCVKWGGEGHLYSASRDGSIKVWSSIDGRLLYTLSGHGHWVNTMALSTDLIIRLGPYPSPPTASSSLSSRNKLTVDEVKQRYLEHRGPTERLVSGSDDFTLHLWTGNVKKLRLPGHQGLVNQVSFSKLGDLIVSASFDKSIKLWHGHSGECLATFLGHVGAVYQLMFSPDTRWIVSCSKDGTCKVWELATRKLKVDLPGHRDEIYAVDWSPSGDFVCSGGKDRVLKIWRY